MDLSQDEYLLLLLSDGNLPTGSFVSSSGLESFVKHGFLGLDTATKDTETPIPRLSKTDGTVNFIRDSLFTYAHTALPFVSDAHITVSRLRDEIASGPPPVELVEEVEKALLELDELYECMMLNHVARRASQAQGVALLTLYSKGFTKPSLVALPAIDTKDSTAQDTFLTLIDDMKLRIRASDTPGHLPICWGILTAALGLSLERSQYLHLFLQARSLISAAIRMNTIGPYASQQLLLHVIKPLCDSALKQTSHIRTQASAKSKNINDEERSTPYEDDDGPATTWPLGEILGARHDLLHSRIFNS
ncbi:hypothetical protein SISNIDRAFT_418522 [Sistotremastrum niveocremeum HHB9708]|uniref:Urease accessory protein UreF n=1 Tax=Sistotremastrum niveocremeum HHB9708 TaxID=1314777 RepID=A0A164NY64_9AGAM|nr:hypothetical protein SISNIDRAFT_418522 [Sistotremastrum niveocremeum HHB9708]